MGESSAHIGGHAPSGLMQTISSCGAVELLHDFDDWIEASGSSGKSATDITTVCIDCNTTVRAAFPGQNKVNGLSFWTNSCGFQ